MYKLGWGSERRRENHGTEHMLEGGLTRLNERRVATQRALLPQMMQALIWRPRAWMEGWTSLDAPDSVARRGGP